MLQRFSDVKSNVLLSFYAFLMNFSTYITIVYRLIIQLSILCVICTDLKLTIGTTTMWFQICRTLALPTEFEPALP